MDRSFLIIDPMDFNTFSKCWFEVGVRHPSKMESPANTSLDPSPSFNSPIISLSNFDRQSPYYMEFEKQPETLESKWICSLSRASLVLSLTPVVHKKLEPGKTCHAYDVAGGTDLFDCSSMHVGS